MHTTNKVPIHIHATKHDQEMWSWSYKIKQFLIGAWLNLMDESLDEKQH